MCIYSTGVVTAFHYSFALDFAFYCVLKAIFRNFRYKLSKFCQFKMKCHVVKSFIYSVYFFSV